MGGQRQGRPFYPRGSPGTHCLRGWVGPRAGLDRCGKSRPDRHSIPGPSNPWRVAIPTALSRPTLRPEYRQKSILEKPVAPTKFLLCHIPENSNFNSIRRENRKSACEFIHLCFAIARCKQRIFISLVFNWGLYLWPTLKRTGSKEVKLQDKYSILLRFIVYKFIVDPLF